ncbi:hypothetical protein ACEQ8H_007434 [Pleosporales sp. CAS-2024a]
MPLEIHPMTLDDTLSWVRIRNKAYYGPTHDVIHNGPVSEETIRRVAEDWKAEIHEPNTWHYKVVDTDLATSSDDPLDNRGQTIAFAVWAMRNVKAEVASDLAVDAVAKPKNMTTYSPPELRFDVLKSLLRPLRAAMLEIMGTTKEFFMLNSIATLPDHQGRGAGRLLLDWGMKKADDEGLLTYLTATSAGKRMYEKRGFVDVKTIKWDRTPWGGEGADCHWCMWKKGLNR